MRKRKYGYILLTLLVVFGLAGTPTSETINKKERKAAADIMKDTKAEVLKAVKGLSERQLDFKAAPDQWSVKECMYHIAISEKNIWAMLDATLKTPANPEKRSEIKLTDEQIIKALEDRSVKRKTFEQFEPKNTPYKSMTEAIDDFKATRSEHIKFIKNTTEDLRNHVAQTPLGWVDCYQISLFMAAHSNRHMQQMNEVKANSNFPKQ